MKKLHRERGKRKMIRLGKVRYYPSILFFLFISLSLFFRNTRTACRQLAQFLQYFQEEEKGQNRFPWIIYLSYSFFRYQVDHHGSYSIKSRVFFRNKYVCMTNNIHPLFSPLFLATEKQMQMHCCMLCFFPLLSLSGFSWSWLIMV